MKSDPIPFSPLLPRLKKKVKYIFKIILMKLSKKGEVNKHFQFTNIIWKY